MGALQGVHDRLEARGELGPSLRLDSVSTARTYRKTPAGVNRMEKRKPLPAQKVGCVVSIRTKCRVIPLSARLPSFA